MRLLSVIAAGLLVVAIDLRIATTDLVPDPLGWLLIAYAAWRLAVPWAAATGLAAAALSVPEMRLPFHYEYTDPMTGRIYVAETGEGLGYPEHLVFDDLRGWRLGITALAMVAAGATLWVLLSTLARRAGADRARGAWELGTLRWLTVAVWAVPYVLVAAAEALDDGRFDPIWNGGLEAVALLGLLVLGWLMVVLVRDAGAPWAQPLDLDDESPWSALRLDAADRQRPAGAPDARRRGAP